MKNNLLKKLFQKQKDEILGFLEERYDNFIKKINFYGYRTIKEYENAGRESFAYQHNRSQRYSVTCDC